MTCKLSIQVKDDLATSLKRAAGILGVPLTHVVVEALEEKIASYRGDPHFQARREAWLRTDDGLAPPAAPPAAAFDPDVAAFMRSQREAAEQIAAAEAPLSG